MTQKEIKDDYRELQNNLILCQKIIVHLTLYTLRQPGLHG